MTQHSPGPWTVDRNSDGRTGIHIRSARVLEGAVKGVSVARMTEGKSADAALISAAPDLLAALKNLMNQLDGWEHPNRYYAAARAAIAKAEQLP